MLEALLLGDQRGGVHHTYHLVSIYFFPPEVFLHPLKHGGILSARFRQRGAGTYLPLPFLSFTPLGVFFSNLFPPRTIGRIVVFLSYAPRGLSSHSVDDKAA